MPTDFNGPAYFDSDNNCYIFGANSPDEALALLGTGDYGLEVGTIDGEDYASILPNGELDNDDWMDMDLSDFLDSFGESGAESGGYIYP